MGADQIDSIQGVQSQSQPTPAIYTSSADVTPAAPQPVSQPTTPHIDFSSDDVQPQAVVETPTSSEISYTTTPFHREDEYDRNQNGDGIHRGDFAKNPGQLAQSMKDNVARMTYHDLSNKAKPVNTVIDTDKTTFAPKPEYEIANFNYSAQDIKSSPSINKYFYTGVMPGDHGCFRAGRPGSTPNTLVVVNLADGKPVSTREEWNAFYKFASKTIEAERAAAS